MVRVWVLLVLLALLTACSYESRLGLSRALQNSADNIGRSTTCSTTYYGGKGGRYTANTFCY